MPRKEETDKKQVQDVFSEERLNRKLRRAIVGLEPFDSRTLGGELSAVVNRIIDAEREKMERLVWRVINETTKERGFVSKLRAQINAPAPQQDKEEKQARREKKFMERQEEKKEEEKRNVKVLTAKQMKAREDLRKFKEGEERKKMEEEEKRTREAEKMRKDRGKINSAVDKATPEDATDIKVLSSLQAVRDSGKVRFSQKDSRGKGVIRSVKVDL